MTYYAFEFWSNSKTTTGNPNQRTNRLSIAGNLAVFSKISDRNLWVQRGKITSDMQGNCRKPVSAKEARQLNRGLSINDYQTMVAQIQDQEIP